jgi:hypothetical protein
VDNGSTDDSVALVTARFPDIGLVRHQTNLGFAAGNNGGIRAALAAGADYVWLLNNDTVVAADAVANLVRLAQTEANVGAIGARVVYYDQPDRLWLGGMRFRHGIYFVQLGEQKGLDYSQVLDVDFVSGCAMFLPRPVLDTIGLLDEQYFMYYEDLDYCFRLKRTGWRILYTPNAVVRHKVSQSMDGGRSPYKQYLNIGSALRFYSRNLRGLNRAFNVAIRLAHAVLVLFSLLVNRRFDPANIGWYLRGVWSAVKSPRSR